MKNNIKKYSRNLALIGAGFWGKNLARNFDNLGALHTICDSSDQAAKNLSLECKDIKFTQKISDVWENDEITRVAIAAPAAMHFEIAKEALEVGKDVFVEKPLCLDIRDARELTKLASKKSLLLMVGHLLQYHPCIEKIKSLLDEGELGKIQYICSNRLNLGKIRREENALWSLAPHDLSVILSLVGDILPDQVQCVGGSYINPEVVDTTMTTLKFPEGLRAHVYVSWLNPFKEQKLTVIGSNGMIVFDDQAPWQEKLTIYKEHLIWKAGQVAIPSKTPGEFVHVKKDEPLKRECEHFLDCCEERRIPKTDGEEGCRVLTLLQKAQLSMEKEGITIIGNDLKISDSGINHNRKAEEDHDNAIFVHSSAVIDEDARIGRGTKIWHFSHICSGTIIGKNCVFGQNTMVASGVCIGNNVKVQNNVSIYSGVTVEDDVFLGPSCVLTNVSNPRSQINRQSIYEKTTIKKGATVGANATIIPGVTLGRYCFVSAGAVVTKDVPDYTMVKGVPAKCDGWISRHGHPISQNKQGDIICPESGLKYKQKDGNLICVNLGECEPLPENLRNGKVNYRNIKNLHEQI